MTNGNDRIDSMLDPNGEFTQYGLTKREYFAAMAMRGYISAGSTGMPPPSMIAAYSIRAADALIDELNKNQPNE